MQRPPDLVDRAFRADAPNRLWMVDFTYGATWQTMAYTAFVIDVFSRRLVGWRTASAMPTELPLDAPEMARSASPTPLSDMPRPLSLNALIRARVRAV